MTIYEGFNFKLTNETIRPYKIISHEVTCYKKFDKIGILSLFNK